MTKYKHVLERKFLPYATSQGVRWASAFRERHFWGFFDTLSELAEKTRYTEATVVKQLFRWLHREGLISANPITRCRLREPEPTERHCFTPEQVNAMLDRANPVLHPKLIVLAYTGLRFGELRDLRWTDVDYGSGTNGVLRIRRGGSTDSTKTRRSRRIPMHPDVRRAIDSAPRIDGSDLVFHEEPTPSHPELDAPLRERRLLNQIKRLLCVPFLRPHVLERSHEWAEAREEGDGRQALEQRLESTPAPSLVCPRLQWGRGAEAAEGAVLVTCCGTRPCVYACESGCGRVIFRVATTSGKMRNSFPAKGCEHGRGGARSLSCSRVTPRLLRLDRSLSTTEPLYHDDARSGLGQ